MLLDDAYLEESFNVGFFFFPGITCEVGMISLQRS
jgi:hypothetical protein